MILKVLKVVRKNYINQKQSNNLQNDSTWKKLILIKVWYFKHKKALYTTCIDINNLKWKCHTQNLPIVHPYNPFLLENYPPDINSELYKISKNAYFT